jgi:enoyl-CoA hydratase/carnithine racemase
VAGADIKAFQRHLASGELGLEAARAYLLAGQALMNQIEQAPVPVIAAINGVALGGGLELALACHLRVAAPSARLGQPEINLGLIPAWGGTQRLPRLIGPARALELILTGDGIDAGAALALGLVNAVSPTPLSTAQVLAGKLAAKGREAVTAALNAHRAVAERPQHQGLQLEAELALQLFQTDNMREGVSAFLEKRAADFNR